VFGLRHILLKKQMWRYSLDMNSIEQKDGMQCNTFRPAPYMKYRTNKQMEDCMKTALALCLGLMVLVAAPVRALDETLPTPRFVNATVDQSEKSLKLALESISVGSQLTAAQTVRELKTLLPKRSFSSLVIPLMRIVKDENCDVHSRVLAAIALHDLHSAMGDFAISRTAQFTDNQQVKHVCMWLTYDRKSEEK
jgi:hypothetical protein